MNILLADFHKYVGYSGGIEKVLSRMATAMAGRGHSVTVVFADEKEGEPFFPLPEGVRMYNLYRVPGKPRVYPSSLIKLLRELLRPISREAARDQNFRLLRMGTRQAEEILKREKPDIIISFREPTGRLFYECVKTEIPMISMLHNDPDEIFRGAPEMERHAVRDSARIQVLFPSFAEKAKKPLRGAGHYVVIPNAVDVPEEACDPGAARRVHTITCVGRLTGRTKRQHLLVEAFEQLAADFPDWQVELWGAVYDKPYVAKLKAEIKKAGFSDRVRICGTTQDMDAVWKKTDIFAFPSHHEGFPLALSEAMARGIPAVGYKACPAVNELILDGKTGFLTEEGAEPFADALRKLMEDAELRRVYGSAGREEMEEYRDEVVWNKWDALIREVVEEKKRKETESGRRSGKM